MIDVKEARRISSVSRKAIDEGFERFMNTDILPAIDAVVRAEAATGESDAVFEGQWLQDILRGLFNLTYAAEFIAARLVLLGYQATYSPFTTTLYVRWGNK